MPSGCKNPNRWYGTAIVLMMLGTAAWFWFLCWLFWKGAKFVAMNYAV